MKVIVWLEDFGNRKGERMVLKDVINFKEWGYLFICIFVLKNVGL